MRWQMTFWSLSLVVAASGFSLGNWCYAGGCGCERAPAPTCAHVHHYHHRHHCHSCQPPAGILVQSAPVMQAPVMQAPVMQAPIMAAPVQMVQMAPVSFAPMQYQAPAPAQSAPPALAPNTCAAVGELLRRMDSAAASGAAPGLSGLAPPTPPPDETCELLAADVKSLRSDLAEMQSLMRAQQEAIRVLTNKLSQ